MPNVRNSVLRRQLLLVPLIPKWKVPSDLFWKAYPKCSWWKVGRDQPDNDFQLLLKLKLMKHVKFSENRFNLLDSLGRGSCVLCLILCLDLQMNAVGITENVKGDHRKFEIWYSGREEVYVVQVCMCCRFVAPQFWAFAPPQSREKFLTGVYGCRDSSTISCALPGCNGNHQF